MEQAAIGYLQKDPLAHIDMLEPLRLKEARVIRADEGGVLIHHASAGAYMLSAASREKAEEFAALMEAPAMIVLHQPYLKAELMRRFSLKGTLMCYQTAWLKEAPAPLIPGPADIRPLTQADLPFVLAHYHSIPDERYIRGRIEAGMLGAYVEGELAGFIGVHTEGTMGLLEIAPAYRRRGLALQLESALMVRQQSLGRIPYAQIKEGNEASLLLHQKLGMEITAEASLCWLY